MSRLSENMKLIRLYAGISQSQLARELCVSRNQINNYENAISEPSIGVLHKFCAYFKVSMDGVVGMELKARILDEWRVKDGREERGFDR